MTETFCDSGHVKLKAGSSATALTTAQYTTLINQAENFINVQIAHPSVNFITQYATLNVDVKQILQDAASSHAAMVAIGYDLSGYGSLRNAETLLDINLDRFNRAIALLKDKRHTDFMRNA